MKVRTASHGFAVADIDVGFVTAGKRQVEKLFVHVGGPFRLVGQFIDLGQQDGRGSRFVGLAPDPVSCPEKEHRTEIGKAWSVSGPHSSDSTDNSPALYGDSTLRRSVVKLTGVSLAVI